MNFEVGQKYFNIENGQMITIADIFEETIIAGTNTNRIIYNIDGKKAGHFLEDSVFVNNLIPVWETINVRSA